MAKKIQIVGNYTTVTDTVTSDIQFETPTVGVRYIRRGDYVELFPNDSRTHQLNIKVQEDNFVDSADDVIADIYAWLQTNTGA
tara:strand:+ start:4028 stop:4276 length:249 start_codon:yes stop_codon:yes gene_type:complete